MSIRLNPDTERTKICGFTSSKTPRRCSGRLALTRFLSGRLVDLAHLHVGVYSEIRIPNGRTGRRRLMARRHFEVCTETFDRVGISIAPGARHGKGPGGDKFVERSAMAIQSNVTALGLSDLQQVHTNAGQADRLRWSRALVCCWHLLEIVMEDGVDHSSSDKNGSQCLHKTILGRRGSAGKCPCNE